MTTSLIKVEGLKELEKALHQLPAKLAQKHLRRGVARMGKVVRDAIRARAPVKTGQLKRNIVHVRSRRLSGNGRETYNVLVRTKRKKYADNRANRRAGKVGKSYTVEGDAYYWKYLEFGSSKISARPFMRPGFEASKTQALEAMQKLLKESLDELAKEYKIK